MKKLLFNTLYSFMLAVMLAPSLFAQETSERMAQDIEIMENILSEMLQHSSHSHNKNLTGQYIKNLGVVFKVATNSYALVQSNGTVTVSRSQLPVIYYDSREGKNNNFTLKGKEFTPIEDFFVRYGEIASQLDDDEAIIISLKNKSGLALVDASRILGKSDQVIASTAPPFSPSSKITLKAFMKDIRAFNKGNITEEELKKRIIREEIDEKDAEPYEYKAFGKIINEKSVAVKADVTRSIVKGIEGYKGDEWQVKNRFRASFNENDMEYIPGIGYTFTYDFVRPPKSSVIYLTFDGRWNNDDERKSSPRKSMHTIFDDSDTYEKWHMELISELKGNVPTFILNYGRILTSLPDGETIIISFNLPQNDVKLPEKLSFTVGKSTLANYNKGAISLSKAVGEVNIN